MSRHPSCTLERVAMMLPAEDKERFLILVARFRNVPQDDEYLLVLEAIGFMTLLWSSVPKEILRILEGANPVAESSASLRSMVREAVSESIPSHQDLRSIAHILRDHETALRAALACAKPARPANTSNILQGLFLTVVVLVFAALTFQFFNP